MKKKLMIIALFLILVLGGITMQGCRKTVNNSDIDINGNNSSNNNSSSQDIVNSVDSNSIGVYSDGEKSGSTDPNNSSNEKSGSSSKSSNIVSSTQISSKTSSSAITNTSTNIKLVGVAYSTWFPPQSWSSVWGKPTLGHYNSSNTSTIKQHIQWLTDAGVDYVMIDWTNNINYIKGTNDGNIQYVEEATDVFFDVLNQMHSNLKVVIAIGTDSPDAFFDGRMKRKLDQVYSDYISNSTYKNYYQLYQGKPLVTLYAGTPAFYNRKLPPFTDSRVNLKFFTGFLSSQPLLFDVTTNVSKYGYWSWWERGNNCFAIGPQNNPECITIAAAWKGETGWRDSKSVGRKDGQTYIDQWNYAISKNPDIIMVNAFNQWVSHAVEGNDGENLDAEYSTDIEPSVEWGYKYLDLTRKYAAIYKTKK